MFLVQRAPARWVDVRRVSVNPKVVQGRKAQKVQTKSERHNFFDEDDAVKTGMKWVNGFQTHTHCKLVLVEQQNLKYSTVWNIVIRG